MKNLKITFEQFIHSTGSSKRTFLTTKVFIICIYNLGIPHTHVRISNILVLIILCLVRPIPKYTNSNNRNAEKVRKRESEVYDTCTVVQMTANPVYEDFNLGLPQDEHIYDNAI